MPRQGSDAMDPEFSRLRALFEQAMDLPPAEREKFLDRQCGGDTLLRERILALIATAEQAGDFLGEVADETRESPDARLALLEGPGAWIGPYKLLELIGEGGFGTVFHAEQHEPIRRRVALKIIKLGMDTKQVIARFEAERQALAMMEHPSIARVLDAGATDSGRPYFVMELVRGDAITTYCDENRLDIRERLDLFQQVCRAVQHAHTKGIIHRDLKPSNILVTQIDGRAVPKVIDFGIAKATSARLTEKTLFTEHRQLIGTPAYMSPEQAAMSGVDIDTRSDIYSLGVLLYELLAGAPPFDPERLRSAAFAEMQRIIREEDPPRPSTRLSTLATAERVAAQRSLEPSRLGAVLRGELDWIIMRAMEKERARRYVTANGLAEDIARHLNGEPVLAVPPSTLYRARKIVRRHRAKFAISAAFVLLLASATVVSAGLWLRAEGQALQARRERDQFEKIAREMESTWDGLTPKVAQGRDTTILRELMQKSADRIRDGELAAAPEAELRMRLTIGRVYWALGEYVLAHEMLDPTPVLASGFDGADRFGAHARRWLGQLFLSEGQNSRALAEYTAALELYRKVHKGDHLDIVQGLVGLGAAHNMLYQLNAGASRHTEALAMSRRLVGHNDPTPFCLLHVAWSSRHSGRVDEAIAAFSEVLAIRRQESRGADSLDVADTLRNLAACYWDLDRHALGIPLHEEALAIQQRLLGPDHPWTATSVGDLGYCLMAAGDPQRGAALMGEALRVLDARLAQTPHHERVEVRAFYAEALRRCGRLAEAEQAARELLALTRSMTEEDLSNSRPLGEWTMMRILLVQGRRAEALEMLRKGVDLTAVRGLARAANLGWYALALLDSPDRTPADVALAEAATRESLAIHREIDDGLQSRRVWHRLFAQSLLGEAIAAQDRFAEAEPLLTTAAEALAEARLVPPASVRGFEFRGYAIQRVIDLYQQWHEADPGAGHDQRALQWSARLNSIAKHP
jgi:eukaryotic-like serine/threonine-protein kinase